MDPGILGDPMRREIFERVARRPASVGELAESLPITRQAVSQHLRVLRDGGLVIVEPQGTRRIYRIDPDGLAGIRAYFQRIWDHSLAAFQKAAEAAAADTTEQEPNR